MKSLFRSLRHLNLAKWKWPHAVSRRRVTTNPRDAAAANNFRLAREQVRRNDLDMALDRALTAAAEIANSADHDLMYKIGSSLRALGARDAGFQLIAKAEQIRTGSDQQDWTGDDISDRTLVIEWRRGDIGIGIRSAGLVAHAARHAKQCIVFVEPRLVPLYRRTLENVDVRSKDNSLGVAPPQATVASFHTLDQLFGPGSRNPAPFLALRTDPALVKELRKKYERRASRPLVGISWGSSVKKKGFPPVEEWANLLRSVPATYVSLQYGDVSQTIKQLENTSGAAIVDDKSVDQLIDMDRFAAQVAALDAVVSIRNSIGHTAGALGVPSIAILDDGVWDPKWVLRAGNGARWSDRNSWYPTMQMVHRKSRPWSEVLQETGVALEEKLRQVRTTA
jgi:hypothetical protein